MKVKSNIAHRLFALLMVAGVLGAAVVPQPVVAFGAGFFWKEFGTVQIQENGPDDHRIIVDPTSGLVTTEDGDTAVFTVRLSQRPHSAVKIELESSDPGEGFPSPSRLVLNPGNWSSPHPVTVTGVDDGQPDGDIAYSILTAPAVSNDDDYDGMDPADVALTNRGRDSGLEAIDDNDILEEDSVVTTDVLANDSVLLTSPYEVTIDEAPGHGVAQVTPQNRVTYTPNPNFNGSDRYRYQVCDSTGSCDDAGVSITVAAVNDPPVANNDSANTEEGTPLLLDILANDSDVDGDRLRVQSVTQPAHGTAVIDDDQVHYTPDDLFTGTDTFSYQAGDGHGGSDQSTVTLSVHPVNDPPDAVDDSITTAEDTQVVIPVLNNDDDPDGNVVYLLSFETTSANGGAILRDEAGTPWPLTDDDRLVYTPQANFTGTDTFRYTVSDLFLTDNATVTVIVQVDHPAPIANEDKYQALENTTLDVAPEQGVISNDVDRDERELAAALVSDVSNGALTFNSDGSFSYSPDPNFAGADSFSYKVSDGTLESNIAAVTIEVENVNDNPIAVDDAYTTGQNQALAVPSVGVLENDNDPDADPLSAVLSAAASHGEVQLNEDGSFTYTPEQNFLGVDSFRYRATDGISNSNDATVEISVLDTQSPDVNWIQPVSNEQRYDAGQEIVTLQVDAVDNLAVARVDFFRWDAVKEQYVNISSILQTPYQIDIDTRYLNLEWNQVFARAFDATGNASERRYIWIYQSTPVYPMFLPVSMRNRAASSPNP